MNNYFNVKKCFFHRISIIPYDRRSLSFCNPGQTIYILCRNPTTTYFPQKKESTIKYHSPVYYIISEEGSILHGCHITHYPISDLKFSNPSLSPSFCSSVLILFSGARTQPRRTQPRMDTTQKDTTQKDITQKGHNLERT